MGRSNLLIKSKASKSHQPAETPDTTIAGDTSGEGVLPPKATSAENETAGDQQPRAMILPNIATDGLPAEIVELSKEDPPLLQPSLGADGWDSMIDDHHARIITALVFTQNLIDENWEVIRTMMLESSDAVKLQKEWTDFKSCLELPPEEKAKVEPDPISYQESSDSDSKFTIGWAYVPIYFIDSELLEAVSFDIHEIAKSSSDRQYDGYYDVNVLSYLAGFDHVREVRLPKTIKISSVSLGRP